MVKKAWNLGLVVALVLTAGCELGGREGDTAAQQEAADYQLEVLFLGLQVIEEVDDGRVWSLLVDADYTGTPTPNELPPCVDVDQSGNFPPHVPTLKLTAGKILGGDDDMVDALSSGSLDLKYYDVRLNEADGTPTKDLGTLMTATTIGRARGESVSIGEVDPIYLAEEIGPLGDDRLAARVAIGGTGELLARPDNQDEPVLYSALAPDESTSCSRVNPQPYAEEVVLTENRTASTVLRMIDTRNGQESRLELGPDDEGVLRLVVGNQVANHADQHFEAYRWVYRVFVDDGNCGNDYFPCEVDPPVGGTKCPISGGGGG